MENRMLQDELIGALIGLVRASEGNEHMLNEGTDRLILEGLAGTGLNTNYDEASIRELIARVRAEKDRLVPDCAVCTASCGRTEEYDMKYLWEGNEDVRSLKTLIITGMGDIADCTRRAGTHGILDEEGMRLLYRGLYFIGRDETAEDLLPLVMEVGGLLAMVRRGKDAK